MKIDYKKILALIPLNIVAQFAWKQLMYPRLLKYVATTETKLDDSLLKELNDFVEGL